MSSTSTQPSHASSRGPSPVTEASKQHKRERRAAVARYVDEHGAKREIIVRRGARDRTLVIDREARSRRDPRLVAALAPDEPPENAAIVCRLYLSHPDGRYARAVTSDDLLLTAAASGDTPASMPKLPHELRDHDQNRYRIEQITKPDGANQLHWVTLPAGATDPSPRPLALRGVIGAMQEYEPAVALTEAAIAAGSQAEELATELRRLGEAPLVLNRRLREKVLAIVERGDLSMSEIAMRCGHVKRDRKGNRCGETSWLARRLGLMTETGRARPTAWIRSDVLATIAAALGLNPGEVEQ
jgi:hypothetical protein